MAEIRALVKTWKHHRDTGWYEQPIGSNYWRLLWDSGCYNDCHRCQLEKLLDRLERKP